MLRKLYYILGLASLLSVLTLTSCSDEQGDLVGEGTIFLSARVNSDVTVVKQERSRAAVEDELAQSTIIWISNSEGVVRRYNSMSEVPATGIKLMADDYTFKAWAGKAEYASFTSRWFEGSEEVSVSAGSKTAVELVCKIANVVTSVNYAEDIDNYITDYQLMVSNKGGVLTFDGKDNRKGYFMMPEGETDLTYVFTGTCNGERFEQEGTIANVESAHEYVINVFVGDQDKTPFGGGFVTIQIDDTMIEVTDEVLITTPPSITGQGFDISATVAGESGSISSKVVYVCSATDLRNLKIEGAPGIDSFDFVTEQSGVLSEIATKGITREVSYVEGAQVSKITFKDFYLNTLINREEPYEIIITATDGGYKTATANLRIRVSEAPVATGSVVNGSIGYTTATLSALAVKDVESAGFEYRIKGSQDWTYVEGSASRAAMTKGQTFYANIKGLQVMTVYEYRAVSGTADAPNNFKGEVMQFTTQNGPQLPNAGMESWVSSGKVLLPTHNASDKFWDTGNHGSSTMSVNVTQSSTARKHSGSYAAALKSQFVGMLGIGKFAAGNIFIGKYLKTDGTDGELGFGRPFSIPADLKVKSLRVWVHYTPGAANDKGAGSYVPKGSLDQANVYIALFDGTDDSVSATDSEGQSYQGKYGCIIRTKSGKLLDKHASNVVAYAEHPITSGTSGDSMVQIELPLEYYKNSHPTHIVVVCSASRYGDYFQGGENSLLYVDDFELIYEKK